MVWPPAGLARSDRACRDREDGRHGCGIPSPCRRLGAEMTAPGGRERVEACAAVILGHAPLRLDVLASLEPMQRLIEGAVIDADGSAGLLGEPARDGEAVHRAPAQRLENEEIEGSLEQRE